MRRYSLLLLALVAFVGFAISMRAGAERPDGPPPGGDQQGQGDRPPEDRGPGGQGGPGGGGYHLLPRFAEERLELTDDQRDQIKKLEDQVKSELAKILTPEQVKILNESRPPRPNGGNGQQGGPGGNGGGQQRQDHPPRNQ